ncbi:hypothetical protein TNCV_1349881 [Trichonephila clavipes]|nr:hypothetical protein TNCV_1349881 [Trichonephila clavipes]
MSSVLLRDQPVSIFSCAQTFAGKTTGKRSLMSSHRLSSRCLAANRRSSSSLITDPTSPLPCRWNFRSLLLSMVFSLTSSPLHLSPKCSRSSSDLSV